MREYGEESAFMLLQQLVHLSRYQAERSLETLGLKPSQAGILFVLHREGGLSLRQLSEKIGITPPSMTVAIRKLEKMGYVIKEHDENDQRMMRIRLDTKGMECLEELKGVISHMEEILYQGLSSDERMFFRRILLEMRKNFMNMKDFKGMDMRSIMKKTCSPGQREF